MSDFDFGKIDQLKRDLDTMGNRLNTIGYTPREQVYESQNKDPYLEEDYDYNPSALVLF